MVSAGQLDRRCRFERRGAADDGYGNPLGGWALLLEAFGGLTHKPGREALAAGRLEAVAMAQLTIRDSAAARGITPADQVVIDGATYAIRSIEPPGRTGRIVMQVERGVAS